MRKWIDKWKTALKTCYGNFEYRLMLCNLSSAQTIPMRFVNCCCSVKLVDECGYCVHDPVYKDQYLMLPSKHEHVAKVEK